MLTGSTRQILPVGSDSSTYYVALQPKNSGPTSYDYVGTTITYNASQNQLSVAGSILPTANNAITLGNTSSYWSTIFGVTFVGTSTTAKYADLAEKYIADDEYKPGTVLIFGGQYDVTISNTKNDTRIAGVVSTNPAYLMNDNSQDSHWISVALVGKVPCKVKGPVDKGTLLVSSELSGIACAIDELNYRPGCVIGKSMDVITDDSIKDIEISVGRF